MLWCFVKCCGVLHFRATVERSRVRDDLTTDHALCWCPHVVAAVMWHDVRGCSTKQVIIRQSVSVIPLGDGPVARSITAQGLEIWCQYIPPTFVSQCCLRMESHMFYIFFPITSLMSKSMDKPFASGRKPPCVSDSLLWTMSTVTNELISSLDYNWEKAICLSFAQTQVQIHVSYRDL